MRAAFIEALWWLVTLLGAVLVVAAVLVLGGCNEPARHHQTRASQWHYPSYQNCTGTIHARNECAHNGASSR